MRTLKAIDLLVRRAVPKDFHDAIPDTYDKGGLEKLLSKVGERDPSRYKQVAKALSDVGRNTTWLRGDTIGLDDFEIPLDRQAIYDQMEHEIDAIEKQGLPSQQELDRINEVRIKYADELTRLSMDAASKSGSGIYNSVVSGARGSKEQMRAMVATPALYSDQNDRILPIFVKHSFGEGLRPYEFIGGSFGTRKSVVSTKAGTANAGDKSKQLVQMAADQVITMEDCGARDGTPWDLDERDVQGTVLAREVGGFPAGTVLGNKVVGALQAKGITKVLSRSPLTCKAPQGICAKCLGANSRGEFKPVGYSAGVTAAQAVGEPLAQVALNEKHSAGMAKGKRKISGLGAIDQFIQSPDTFPNKAAVATVDGTVERIYDAPQGGRYISIEGRDHYVPKDFEITTKVNDVVEAGDILSDGLADPEDIVRYKGLGSGRMYWTKRLKQIMDDSNIPTSRRHTELLARSALNHVRVTGNEPIGDALPDDIVSYNHLQQSYVPHADAKEIPVDKPQYDTYLEQPVMYHTIGTRVTPRIVSEMKEMGVTSYLASPKKPDMEPELIRARTASPTGKGWFENFFTSYIGKNLEDSAVRGKITDFGRNTHYIPRLAIGEGYGKTTSTTGEF